MTNDQIALMTAEDEAATARAIEAGVLAAAALADGTDVAATPEELAVLVRLGELATTRLLTAHVGLVRHLVAQAMRAGGTRDDVDQEAWAALVEALRRFDHRRGRFVTYATTAVQGAVRAAVARENGLSERQARGLRRIRSAEATLTHELGRIPSAAEVAACVERDVRWVSWCGVRGAATAPDVLDTLSEGRFATSPGESADHLDLRRLIAALPEPERAVVTARFPRHGQARSYEDLAEWLGVSTSTVRRLERRGLDRLRHWLSADESRAA